MSITRNERLCFESTLAATILQHPHYFIDVVGKISSNILNLLTHPINQAFLAQNEILNDHIILELYSNTHFGTLGPALDFCPSQAGFIQTVMQTLSGSQTLLPKILHLHQIFMRSIYDKLPYKSNNNDWRVLKEKLVNALFGNELFDHSRRIKINASAGDLTTRVGIAGQIDCLETSTTELHRNVLGMFAPNASSPWGIIINTHNLPFVAGPSGHTGTAILVAMLVGHLTQEELKAYVSATISILTGGGYHSVDEMMAIANRTGITYEPGKYHHLIPKKFLCSQPMMTLQKKYPDLIPSEICRSHEDVPRGLLLFESAAHGFIHGITQLTQDVAIKKGLSKEVAAALRQTLNYGSFFSLKFFQHANSEETHDCFDALYRAAIETGQLLLVNVVLDGIIRLAGGIGSRIRNALSFGLFSYAARSNGLSTTLVSTLTSAAVQTATEYAGRKVIK